MKNILSVIIVALLCVNAHSQTIDRSVRPSAAAAKEIKIADAKTFTLSNGLKVFVVEDHRKPIVYYSVTLDIKPSLERNKAGAQDLFSAVFGKATQQRSKEQLNKELDLIAASSSMHSRGGFISFLTKYEQKGLELFADMLFKPSFLQSELDLNVEKTKSGLATIGDNAGEICNRVSNALTYGPEYPSGEVETVQTVENVSLADLQKYYDVYFAPNVARLVIVGDITEAEAKANAQKYFGAWKKKNVPVTQYTIPREPAMTKVAMVEKAGAVQSCINLTYPVDFRIDSPDYAAASVMSYILGGGASGRLFQNLRERHSYTYGVYANLSPGELVGSFSLTGGNGSAASVKASVTGDSFEEILKEIQNFSAPVSDDELKAAKAFLTGSFGRSLEDASTIARFALNIDKYNLPKDFYKNYLKRLDAVTVADVQAVAKKYLHPDNAWIVVVGDKSLASNLNQFSKTGEVQFYNIDAQPVAAPVTQTTDISPETIIGNYMKALGGASAIDKIADYKVTGDVSLMGQKLAVEQMFKRPNRSLMQMTMAGTTLQKIAFDGTTLRISGMQGATEMSEGAEVEDMKMDAGICPEVEYAKNGCVLTVGGIEKLNDKDVYVLNIEKNGKSTVSYFEVESGLKVKTVKTLESPQGEMQVVTEYADYRAVEGVKFPYLTRQSMGMDIEIRVSTIEVNTGLSEDVFK